jgi:hypothetical protein
VEKWHAKRHGARPPGAHAAQSPHAACAHDGTVARSPVAWWRLGGDKVLSVSSWGHKEGAGQGSRGWSSPERCRGVEAVENASGGGIHRWGGSSGGRWQWRHDPAMSAWKREGEGDFKLGQWWRMGGSHHEAAGGGGTQTGTREEGGSPVVEAGEAGA